MRTSTWFQNRWDAFRSNFWFLPAVMSFAAILTCLFLLQIDHRVGFLLPETGAGSLNAMRSVLAVLISALVTGLSIVFSSTVVVLTLAASQLGPRLLRTYVRDRSNQVLIGVFSSTVFYNLTALFVVGRLQESRGIPNLTILGGFLMTCAALFVLIYFIHHVARNIQAPNVILSVSQELQALIRRTYTEVSEDTERHTDNPPILPERIASLHATRSGYIQALDEETLLNTASGEDLAVRTFRRPGDFVIQGEHLADVHGTAPFDEETLLPALDQCFIFGENRTATQDVEFVLIEIVEIALRALSPGINDPFTARACIDKLSEALCLLADREQPRTFHYDGQGTLRLVLNQPSFGGFCDAAFHQIRQNGSANVYILIHMMESLNRIMIHARTETQREVIWRHAMLIRNAGDRLPDEADRRDLDRRFLLMTESFGPPSGTEVPSPSTEDDS